MVGGSRRVAGALVLRALSDGETCFPLLEGVRHFAAAVPGADREG